jgi:ribosomal protein L16 Arg81 hydroxylase
LEKPDREFTLEPGDLVYIPRGFGHEALTAGESSLHITIGIHVQTWLDVTRRVLKILGEQHLELRRSVGCRFGPVPSEGVSKMQARLRVWLEEPELWDKAIHLMHDEDLRTQAPPPDGHFRSLDRLADITTESEVERRQSISCSVRVQEDTASIVFSGNEVSGPVHVMDAFRFIASARRFRILDLPGDLSETSKCILVKKLICEGLLKVLD